MKRTYTIAVLTAIDRRNVVHACSIRPVFSLFVTVLVCLGTLPGAMADNAGAEEIGLKIAQAADEQAKGFGNFTARQTMVLRNKQGQGKPALAQDKGAGSRGRRRQEPVCVR